MTKPHYMQMNWSDYFADTGHLSRGDHGAYMLLLGRMWVAGGALPNDPKRLAALALCGPREWAKVWPSIEGFFQVEGDYITQKRLAAEYDSAVVKCSKRLEAGRAGGRANALKNKERGLANATRLLYHSLESEEKLKIKRFEEEEIRGPLVARYGEEWAVSWLDPCRFVDGVVVAPTRFAADRLKSDARGVVKISIDVEKKGVDTAPSDS